jgi:hypothetical protein
MGRKERPDRRRGKGDEGKMGERKRRSMKEGREERTRKGVCSVGVAWAK